MNAAEFNALCLPHRPALVAYATGLCRDRHEAEDLVQDAYVHALGRWADFVPMEGMEPAEIVSVWLHRITFNRFVSLYRKRRVRARMLEGYRDEVVVEEACQADRPNARLSAGLWGDELEQALAQLDPAWRQIVERVLLKGELHREVAADLGIPLATVLTRVHRARKKLTAELADFAEREYGLVAVDIRGIGERDHTAGHHAVALEAPERVQAQSDRVEGVVAVGDDRALVRRQAG